MTSHPPTASRAPQGGFSHVVGVAQPALSDSTISQCLDHTAAQRPEHLACVFAQTEGAGAGGIRWTWAQLRDKADQLAAGLLSLGLVKGDRVGIWSPNRPEWILAQYATARIGVVLVNINPAYRLAELDYALNKVQCQALITAAAFKTSDYLGMLQTLAPELVSSAPGQLHAARLPHLRSVIRTGQAVSPGMLNFDEVLGLANADLLRQTTAIGTTLVCTDAINVQFTSGTTGQPKGATLSHHNIVNNALSVAAAMGFDGDGVLCIPVPLYHCFGMVMGSLVCTVTGGTMVFPSEGFEPEATLQALHTERCTHLHGVPTMFIAQLDHPRFAEFDLSALRGGIMAGSPCPVEVMKRVNTQMHMTDVTIAYGMTETSPVSFQSDTTDPVDKRVATVGRVLPHLQVKVVDADGSTVPVGATGELYTRGYSVMLGYWDDAARTEEAVVDGWMHTGDLATIDIDGYCNIVGRVKDMLIRGGENVYPREVEEFLFRHPQVAQVQVFGVPDSKYGEAVCAWVVLKAGQVATEEDIRSFCQGQIAHYKVPRYVRFVSELPMTVTGKAQKFMMRQQMMQALGLADTKTA